MRARWLVVSLVFALIFALGGLAGPVFAASNALIHVPQEASLDVAIGRVTDGGVIEIAAGTYASPANGFFINNARKGFVVRAALGATVAIDGGGSRKLLRFINSNTSRGKRVTFQRIGFQNGYSADVNVAGGVTLSAAEAVFQQCQFVNNRAASAVTGGGAVKAIFGSTATFTNCSFRGNSSPLRGGALVVRNSTVTLQGGDMVGNRTNLPGHHPNSFGGAVMVLDGTLNVTNVRFEGNQAGWTGGAIYAIGNWDKGSTVTVSRSTFINNQAAPDPCCVNPLATSGGAIHAEDLAAVRITGSLFQGNGADFGGAVDNYRADVEIHGSVFQANAGEVGGALAAESSDFADPSTGNGAINRRSARLVVGQSLLQGGGAKTPVTGGCILASGDTNRMYGSGGVAQAGTLAGNRATVQILGSVLSDCDVQVAGDGSGGMGGALVADLIDLDLEDSMVLDSDARSGGTGNGVGGGLALRQESNARIVNTTFAGDTAQRWGGAVFLSGSTIQTDRGRFYGNRVGPSNGGDPKGAALYSIPLTNPARPRNVAGLISNSTFAESADIFIWDVDPASGPINDIRYGGNRFGVAFSGQLVYGDSLAAPGGLGVTGLNTLVVSRGSRGSTPKSFAPNTQVLGGHEGDLRAVPSPSSVGAGATATTSYLAYAWTGSTAAVGTLGLGKKWGLLEVPPGIYILTVNGAPAATANTAASCTAGSSLCLAADRFRAEVTWKNGGASQAAHAVSLSGDTGSFWFVDPANVELVVKVLDGRGVNGSFWVFYGGLTNLAYTLTVTDTATGAVKIYNNPAGKFASAGDTGAFPAPGAAGTAVAEEADEEGLLQVAESEPGLSEAAASCAAGATSLCLNGSRFQVQLNWKDFSGKSGVGQAVPLTGDTGYFWFTAQSNVEVIVKVLDGRGLNGHFWVFYGALSNLEYTITVTDTQTGVRKTYTNPAKRFSSQGDTEAIPAG